MLWEWATEASLEVLRPGLSSPGTTAPGHDRAIGQDGHRDHGTLAPAASRAASS
jgi:hypothetical protein